MKNPMAVCCVCHEAVFSSRKSKVTCQQCRIKANAGRKFQRITSKCNWRNGIAPIIPAMDRKKSKKAAALSGQGDGK